MVYHDLELHNKLRMTWVVLLIVYVLLVLWMRYGDSDGSSNNKLLGGLALLSTVGLYGFSAYLIWIGYFCPEEYWDSTKSKRTVGPAAAALNRNREGQLTRNRYRNAYRY